MSKQTAATHQGHHVDSFLTHSCRSRWTKHQTKYQYDSLGQVTSGKKYWSDGTPVAGQQFTYNFDDIGNRQSNASGGDQTGNNLRSANYTVNNLNQITSRDVPGYVDVLGSADPNATVTINLQRAYRHNDYFGDELSVDNSSSAQWFSLTNLAVLNNGTNADIVATNTGSVYVAQTPEVLSYDADGNLTNDGRWSYVWDAENRLIQMTVNTNVGTPYQLTFTYDFQGRRIQKIVATNSESVYTNKFLYDGWNLVAVLTSGSTLQEAFMWGNDLSGSVQGAGGVGGLLETGYNGSAVTNCFSAFDGNGNVAALVNVNGGIVEANYEYGPFGEVIRQTGPMEVTAFMDLFAIIGFRELIT
jgi:YD repeat-containing protein